MKTILGNALIVLNEYQKEVAPGMKYNKQKKLLKLS